MGSQSERINSRPRINSNEPLGQCSTRLRKCEVRMTGAWMESSPEIAAKATPTHRHPRHGNPSIFSSRKSSREIVWAAASHPVSQLASQSARLKQLNYENVYKTGPFSPQQSIRRLRAKKKLKIVCPLVSTCRGKKVEQLVRCICWIIEPLQPESVQFWPDEWVRGRVNSLLGNRKQLDESIDVKSRRMSVQCQGWVQSFSFSLQRKELPLSICVYVQATTRRTSHPHIENSRIFLWQQDLQQHHHKQQLRY